MSSLIVEVCQVEEITPHPNADKVELVGVKGWTCVSSIGYFKVGDKCVYFPPDSVIPEHVAEKFEITKYCSQLAKNPDGTRPSGLRIRAQRFRGEPSFGTVQKPCNPDWEVGTSVVDYYNVTKYEPPIRCSDGDAAAPISAFHGYTDIENIANFPDILTEGEDVIISEKIHGSNCRVGLILAPDDDGNAVLQFMCGSHGQRRKEFNEKGQRSKYWQALTPQVQELLKEKTGTGDNVIVYGELYGAGIQDMTYGMSEQGFRAFDIAVNGKYLNYDEQQELFQRHDVEVAPILYRGPFNFNTVRELTDGPTTLCPEDRAGKFAGREGVVIRPAQERYSGDLPNFGRVILKSISVDYLSRRGGTEFH